MGSTVQIPIESTAFLIDKLPRAFTRQPIGGDVPFGDAGTELILPNSVKIDAAHFPDDVFRAYVAENFDTNSSGWLCKEEIVALDDEGHPRAVRLKNAGVTSLRGIEYLTELTVLDVSGSPALSSVDLSSNTKLRSINFYQTGMVSLDVSGLMLTYLYCDDGPLESLILGPQSDLQMLSCYYTDVMEVNISECPYLIEAWLGDKTGEDGIDSYESGSHALYVNQGATVITGIPAPTFTLPASLTTIEAEAFSGIAAEAVRIPVSVTSISGDPFVGSTVHYIYGSTDLVRNFAQAYGYVFVPVRD